MRGKQAAGRRETSGNRVWPHQASLFRRAASRSIAGGLFALGAIMAVAAADATASARPVLNTNQSFIETMTRDTVLQIDDLMSVFEFVLTSLPSRVTIYPTENYYYFSFDHDGLTYVGNLRLDTSDRDKGVVNFAYFRQYAEWKRGEDPNYRLLGAADGVLVQKIDRLSYSVAFKDTTVRFDMVDLSGVKPPASKLHQDERYIGPVYDESGIQFYLVFNEKLKYFHYILNEEVPVHEKFFKGLVSDRVQIGLRTGFAYYHEHQLDRKILVGVHNANSRVNNYYDGPFDQLPDNFIEGDSLERAILAVSPEMKGTMDRLGNSPDGASRYYIGPYMHYDDETELAIIEECIEDSERPADYYYACFQLDQLDREDDDEAGETAQDADEQSEPANASTGSTPEKRS